MSGTVRFGKFQQHWSVLQLLGEWEKRLEHRIAVTQRTEPLLSNKMFMVSVSSLSSARCRGFVGFDDTWVSCPPRSGTSRSKSPRAQ